VTVADNLRRKEMSIVQPGNVAFVALVRRVRGDNGAEVVSLEETDGGFSVSVVKLFEAWRGIQWVDRKGICEKGHVMDFIGGLGLGANSLCLLSFKKPGTDNTFGWVVINPSTMERCSEAEFYNGVL